jgi:hypothetical protein
MDELIDLTMEGIYEISNTFSTYYLSNGGSRLLESVPDEVDYRFIIYRKGDKFYGFYSTIDENGYNEIKGGECLEVVFKPRNNVNTNMDAEMTCNNSVFKGVGWSTGDELYIDLNYYFNESGKTFRINRHITGKKQYPTGKEVYGF